MTTAADTKIRRHVCDIDHDAIQAMYPPNEELMPDGLHQMRHYVHLIATLLAHFAKRDDVSVGGDVFIYFAEGDPTDRLAPDCYVSFGVDGPHLIEDNSYLVWHAGKVPDFVLEIASVSTARRDLTEKREEYALRGIPEYWLFDPTGGDYYGERLIGLRLVDGVYQPIETIEREDGVTVGRSDELGLDLHWIDGDLRIYDPATGEYLRDPETYEAERRADVARWRIAEDNLRITELDRDTAMMEARTESEARKAAEGRAQVAEGRAQAEAEARRDAESRAQAAEAELEMLREQLRLSGRE